MRKYVFALAAGLAGMAAQAADDALTWDGITLYGVVDLGLGYQNHGTPLNDYFGPGLDYLLQKNSNKPQFSIAPNAMSQSHVGLRGVEELGGGLTALFKIETHFQPYSGNLADHLHAMTENNNVPLKSQTTNADSSRAGQAFQNAYFGLAYDGWGTLTFGRQDSLVLENIKTYDPMGGSQAFSLIGFSGNTGGGGNTEDARLDQTVKYRNKIGMVRFYGLAQVGVASTATQAKQIGIGTDWEGLSVDAVYSNVRNAVSSAPLAAVPTGYAPTTALAGTISNNSALSGYAKYKTGPLTLYGGYERIDYSNPTSPVPAGTVIIGGYVLATVNNTAYTKDKILHVVWGGAKYQATENLALIVGYDTYLQESFAPVSCSNSGNSKCSGMLNTSSLVADYVFNRHADIYTGFMYTHVYGGLDNGYLHNNTIDPMVGFRLRF
jgi:predicted porin